MRNFKLVIAYDGSRYYGWQKTKTGPSIEETLENVLKKILQEPIVLQAASRTDRGVHAEGQVVNFLTTSQKLPTERLLTSVNQLLDGDIVVRSLVEMPISFHPTLDCIGKEYHYHICNSRVQMPRYRHYSWHIPHPLDQDAMNKAAAYITGMQNFKALCNSKKNSKVSDFTREITSINIVMNSEQRITIKISGNHFLYKMGRNIAGLIVSVGIGKVDTRQIDYLLKSQDRSLGSITAPAHGLTLFEVFYHQK